MIKKIVMLLNLTLVSLSASGNLYSPFLGGKNILDGAHLTFRRFATPAVYNPMALRLSDSSFSLFLDTAIKVTSLTDVSWNCLTANNNPTGMGYLGLSRECNGYVTTTASDVTLTSCAFKQCSSYEYALDSDSGNGGAIYIDETGSGTITLQRVVAVYCTAKVGAFAYLRTGTGTGNVVIQDVLVKQCSPLAQTGESDATHIESSVSNSITVTNLNVTDGIVNGRGGGIGVVATGRATINMQFVIADRVDAGSIVFVDCQRSSNTFKGISVLHSTARNGVVQCANGLYDIENSFYISNTGYLAVVDMAVVAFKSCWLTYVPTYDPYIQFSDLKVETDTPERMIVFVGATAIYPNVGVVVSVEFQTVKKTDAPNQRTAYPTKSMGFGSANAPSIISISAFFLTFAAVVIGIVACVCVRRYRGKVVHKMHVMYANAPDETDDEKDVEDNAELFGEGNDIERVDYKIKVVDAWDTSDSDKAVSKGRGRRGAGLR